MYWESSGITGRLLSRTPSCSSSTSSYALLASKHASRGPCHCQQQQRDTSSSDFQVCGETLLEQEQETPVDPPPGGVPMTGAHSAKDLPHTLAHFFFTMKEVSVGTLAVWL